MVCKDLGRHIHIDYCRTQHGEICSGAGIEHIDQPLQPHPNRAKDFLSSGEYDDVDSFMELMLAGRLEVEDEPRRVMVNARQGVAHPRLPEATVTGDFDSLIGFSKNLPLRCALSVFPVPDFKLTLKKSIHLELEVTVDGVSSLRLLRFPFTCS